MEGLSVWRQRQLQLQQVARQAADQPQQPQRQDSSAGRGGLLLPLAGLGAAIMAVSMWMVMASVAAEFPSAAQLAKAEADWERLRRDGLPRQVMVRDWADVDGDAVRANGVLIRAKARPQAIVLPPGGLVLHPIAGDHGCVTLEIMAPGVEPYRLCLPPDRDLPPINVR
ncbi:MAG: hypothetical protein N2690_01165 [Rhodocyclaceae bacterium]|nr:hypothetical protein [Rhodocyclaceae bacterium]